MSTTTVDTWTRPRAGSTSSPIVRSNVPPPSHFTTAQLQELESELRRELAVLERRLVSELQFESAEARVVSKHDISAAMPATNDTAERRDLVASAIARLASGTYGACSRCGEPIPYGRLLVMPEATHCLRCV